jgi:hypothetical protein
MRALAVEWAVTAAHTHAAYVRLVRHPLMGLLPGLWSATWRCGVLRCGGGPLNPKNLKNRGRGLT